ncbi:MAG: protein phosphatase 2C domain-containing protein [Coriobacteriia bacterium]
MELGGVSVPGLSGGSDSAYLLKDLSVFQAQLGGLQTFVMVCDGAAGDSSIDAAAHLAVKAADDHLASILLAVASGKSPVLDPVSALKAIVAEANIAIASGAAGSDDSGASTMFVGAFVSADKIWFSQLGEGRAYLLHDGEARQLLVEKAVPDNTITEGSLPEEHPEDGAQADIAEIALVDMGADIEVDSENLSPGDALILCSQGAAAVLSGSDILAISSVALDAQSAAASLAAAALIAQPENSVTLVAWSDDWARFAPPPPLPPPTPPSAAVVAPAQAVQHDPFRASPAERAWLWVMSVWIVLAFLALIGAAIFSKYAMSPSTTADSSPGAGQVSESTAQGAVVASTAPEVTAPVEPTGTVQAEFPKTLTVPKNVKGGLWLRKKPTASGASNLVIQLKSGAEVQAVDTAEGKDATGKTQQFYAFKVSEIDADQVVETGTYSWPPPKAVKTVYAFAGSFQVP